MQPINIPEAGIEHPVFERLATDEALDIMFTFGYYLDEDAANILHKVFSIWVAKTDWKEMGASPKFITEVYGNTLHLAIAHVPQPQKPVRLLIYELMRSPLSLETVLLVPRKFDAKGRMLDPLPDPKAPKMAAYPDKEAWWQASFDPRQTHPESEMVMPAMSFTEDGKAKVREKRGMKIHLPDCRVVYGIVGAQVFSPNKYCRSIAHLMQELLPRYFKDVPPTLFNKYEQEVPVDLLYHKNRLGYRMRFKPEHLVVSYPKNFRFREYELMLALRDAIEWLKLAPVIHWKRNDWYEVNLWENWVYKA